MASRDPFVAIISAAAELKRAAPEPYEAFIKSMKEYSERAKADLMAADANVIFPAQGKAQALAQLSAKLEDCFTLDEQFKTRSK